MGEREQRWSWTWAEAGQRSTSDEQSRRKGQRDRERAVRGDGDQQEQEASGWGTGGGLRQRETRSPLTLHVKGDEDLGGAGGAAGVADVLARVLLRGAGDDQAAVHHPVLPGQRRPQLRPLDPGRRLACGYVTVRHPGQGGSGQVSPYPGHRPHPVPVAEQCSVAVSPATTVTAGGAVTSGAPGCLCAVSTLTSTRACAEPRALCAVQM